MSPSGRRFLKPKKNTNQATTDKFDSPNDFNDDSSDADGRSATELSEHRHSWDLQDLGVVAATGQFCALHEKVEPRDASVNAELNQVNA